MITYQYRKWSDKVTLSHKLFMAVLEEVLRKLEWEARIQINGDYLDNFFEPNMILFSIELFPVADSK